jgi:hypothetical protein
MFRRQAIALGAATVVAALGLSGCSSESQDPEPTAEPMLTTSQPPPPTELPSPESITHMLYRLADVGIPGSEKLHLVEGATAADAATVDRFGHALVDNGYTPLTLEATDIGWSDADPTDVVATITIHKPGSDTGFSIPMEFKPYHGGWQLSDDTFDMLLNFGKKSTSASPAPPR